eukprot:TRINITY_DN10376_c0_g1_i2.p1 TRINITY_DN10376_c0_g1~~TRINITY_DN10376_c0_g1_i2.p1  ORF type:complete len:155 (-),score=31.34 TRINITY_DN10376_c0_g1_i2:11-475(-)
MFCRFAVRQLTARLAANKGAFRMSRHYLPSAFAVAVVAFSSSLAHAQTMMSDAALPLNARPGECYARVYTAPQFKTTTDTVIKKAASERVNVIPERYEWTEETVMTKPASERIAQVIPAEYRWEEEQVLVKPASEIGRAVQQECRDRSRMPSSA